MKSVVYPKVVRVSKLFLFFRRRSSKRVSYLKFAAACTIIQLVSRKCVTDSFSGRMYQICWQKYATTLPFTYNFEFQSLIKYLLYTKKRNAIRNRNKNEQHNNEVIDVIVNKKKALKLYNWSIYYYYYENRSKDNLLH